LSAPGRSPSPCNDVSLTTPLLGNFPASCLGEKSSFGTLLQVCCVDSVFCCSRAPHFLLFSVTILCFFPFPESSFPFYDFPHSGSLPYSPLVVPIRLPPSSAGKFLCSLERVPDPSLGLIAAELQYRRVDPIVFFSLGPEATVCPRPKSLRRPMILCVCRVFPRSAYFVPSAPVSDVRIRRDRTLFPLEFSTPSVLVESPLGFGFLFFERELRMPTGRVRRAQQPLSLSSFLF